MASQGVKLLGYWASPFSVRVEWALRLKGIEYEYVEDDIKNKSPQLLELNPVHRKVPVLVHGGRPLAESSVILEYIDEYWKEMGCPLLPQDPHRRAMARFWARLGEEKALHNGWMAMCAEGDDKEASLRSCIEAMDMIEAELRAGGREFFGGEKIGYLDLILGWISHWLPVWEEVGSIQIIDPNRFPSITAWIPNFLNHPAIKGKLPPKDKMIVYFQKQKKEVAPLLASRRKS
ncbi:Glutathione transferase [Bertholletia excelsa]